MGATVKGDETAAAAEARGGVRLRKDQGRPAGAGPGPPGEKGKKRKRSLVLSDEAWERLTVHAARERADRSLVVEGLIAAQLRRYVVHDRGGPPPAGQGGAGAGPGPGPGPGQGQAAP